MGRWEGTRACALRSLESLPTRPNAPWRFGGSQPHASLLCPGFPWGTRCTQALAPARGVLRGLDVDVDEGRAIATHAVDPVGGATGAAAALATGRAPPARAAVAASGVRVDGTKEWPEAKVVVRVGHRGPDATWCTLASLTSHAAITPCTRHGGHDLDVSKRDGAPYEQHSDRGATGSASKPWVSRASSRSSTRTAGPVVPDRVVSVRVLGGASAASASSVSSVLTRGAVPGRHPTSEFDSAAEHSTLTIDSSRGVEPINAVVCAPWRPRGVAVWPHVERVPAHTSDHAKPTSTARGRVTRRPRRQVVFTHGRIRRARPAPTSPVATSR